MKGARGWALLAGIGLLAVGIWQVMILSRAPLKGADPSLWLTFLQEETTFGRSWGARIVVLMVAVAPLHAFLERAKGGLAVAARGFFVAWMPLALLVALLQTQSVERIRDLHKTAIAGSEASPSSEGAPSPSAQQPAMEILSPLHVGTVLWRSGVEPVMRVASLLGVVVFSFLTATTHRKARIPSLIVLLILFLVIALVWSPTTEAVILLLEGLTLAVLAFAMPQESDRYGLGRH